MFKDITYMNDLLAYLNQTPAYIELGVVIGAIILSFIAKWGLSKTAFKDEQGEQTQLGSAFEVIAPVFRPLLSVIFISLAQAYMADLITAEQRIITLGYEIAIVWGILRLILFSTDSRGVVMVAGLIGAVLIITNFTGNLQPFLDYLNRFSFKLGSYEFSVVAIFKGLLAIGVLLWLAGVLTKLVRFIIGRFTKMRISNRELLAKASQIGIYFVLFVIALDVMGIDLTALAVFGGAVGVGLGFGLQKITSNFISGLILLVEKTVEVSDVVELENGIYGHVREIGARYTMIETLDTKEVMVPNEEFITTKVTNWTYTNPTGRMEIAVGVHYNSDLKLVQKIVVEALKDHPRVLRKPEPNCLLDEFGDSSVNFRLLFWVDDVSYKYFQVKSDVMMSVWDVLHAHDIEIPFPQRDLNVRSFDPKVADQLLEQYQTHIKPSVKGRSKQDKQSDKPTKKSATKTSK